MGWGPEIYQYLKFTVPNPRPGVGKAASCSPEAALWLLHQSLSAWHLEEKYWSLEFSAALQLLILICCCSIVNLHRTITYLHHIGERLVPIYLET